MARFRVNPTLALAALGVVYGDIGTSPLYTLQTCFNDITVSTYNILGVISLIFWSLILVVSTCYLAIFLNASNDGEGGVLALLSLFDKTKKSYKYLFFAGVIGAGLLMSDGMLTPAVSVMGAMEGLNVISPHFSQDVLPLTVAILLGLFFCQRLGTQKIGGAFGPILLIWFVVIGALGVHQIILNPEILKALNPYYALYFLHHNGFLGFLMLGCVFLAITGAEALYADLGQFGKAPIRLTWFGVVLPGCVLNFFGQGAHLLSTPAAVSNPFYYIAPQWFGYPLLILAAMATIIASQAIISASYSLTKQGILLGVIPRLKVIQTSTKQAGQIYVPSINVFFAIGCIFLVVFFKTSNALTNAYGIAINLEMVIMALLVVCLAYQKWQWSIFKITWIFGSFVVIDLAFLASNIFKIPLGGWMPLAFSLVCMSVMMTWFKGMDLLRRIYVKKLSQNNVLPVQSGDYVPKLTPLEAVFITGSYDQTGDCFFHYFDILQARPKHSIIVTVQIHAHPHIPLNDRFSFIKTQLDMCHITLHFGFKDSIDVPATLKEANQKGLLPIQINFDQVLYFIENIALAAMPGKTEDMFEWQKRFFIFMFKNTVGTFSSLEFLNLPQDRTVTIGTYAEL